MLEIRKRSCREEIVRLEEVVTELNVADDVAIEVVGDGVDVGLAKSADDDVTSIQEDDLHGCMSGAAKAKKKEPPGVEPKNIRSRPGSNRRVRST